MQSNPNDVRRVDLEQIDPPCEEPEEEEPVIDIPKLRELPPDELKKIRRQHQKWLETKGRKGKQADLSFANLQQAALGGANLRQVWFRGANLQQASFHASSLREAHLQNANLTGATGLLASQLAGANVSGATLPKNIHEFKELEQVEKITQKAQKLFLSVLLVCVYCWLTIATTTDVGLLTHSGSSPLPIIQTNIPLAGFYWTAPLVLLGLFFWFHLYLQRLWEQLAKLPAVFPDGKTLNEKVYPWLVSGLVCSHVQLLRKRRPPLSRLQTGLSILLAWWVVPGTFAFFWLRYLPKHHWAGTIEHIMLLVVACIFAAWTQALAKKTLRGQLWPSLPLTQRGKFVAWFISFLKRSWKLTFFGMMIFLLAAVISDGAIQGIPPPKPVYTPQKGEQALRAERPPPPTRPAGGLLNHLMRRYRTIIPELLPSIPLVGARAFADLSAQDVSTRPPNWTLMREEAVEDIVLGAQLRKTDLRAALAHQAFLVKADLREANLQEADFSQANLAKGNLQKANFQEAILREANLREADLFQAQLLNADLQKGNLVRANLQKADLISANLEEANLEEANLRGANLQWVNLQGANLQKALMEGVNLRKAVLVNASLQQVNLAEANLSEANLQKSDLRGANLHKAKLVTANLQQTNLEKADLGDANLQMTDLRGANLQGANLEGANLEGVNLFEAHLEEAIGLNPEQLQMARNWSLAYYNTDLLRELHLPRSHNQNLQKLRLRNYDLADVQLPMASLSKANLQGANLPGANLEGANLQGINLERANLQEANLQGANLQGARLWRTQLQNTKLQRANLLSVKNLTQRQLNQACVDKKTVLPEGLTRPDPCPKKPIAPPKK